MITTTIHCPEPGCNCPFSTLTESIEKALIRHHMTTHVNQKNEPKTTTNPRYVIKFVRSFNWEVLKLSGDQRYYSLIRICKLYGEAVEICERGNV